MKQRRTTLWTFDTIGTERLRHSWLLKSGSDLHKLGISYKIVKSLKIHLYLKKLLSVKAAWSMSPLCDQWESEKVSCCCWTNIWFGSCLLHSGSVANCRRETGDVNTALVRPRIQTISVCESSQNILFKHCKYVFHSLVLCIIHDEGNFVLFIRWVKCCQ